MSEEGAGMVEFSEVAQTKVKEFMKEQDAEDSYLRITVTERPEGGAFYEFGLESEATAGDRIVNERVRTIVASEAVPLLSGASIDYVETMQRSGFVISNPNFAGSCPCGGSCGCG